MSLFHRLHELNENGEPFVLCTLLSSMGHAPQEPGAKAIITSAGLLEGTVGGGKLENRAIQEALQLLREPPKEPQPIVFRWDLQRDIGMSCGGSATLLLEPFHLRVWNIVIFGAGHVSQALSRVLINLRCRVTCVDTREEWVERLPSAQNFAARTIDDLGRFAADIPPGSYCAVITMGHATDFPILRVLLSRDDLAFVGSIGSKVKARAMKADLMRAGLAPERIRRLHCPIGLDLGTRRPEEIAISITAQWLQVRHELSKHRRPAIDSSLHPETSAPAELQSDPDA